jgi:hypothetical protein
MCFSPQADVVGGLVICALGVDAVRHARQRREFLALAWIPLLLGAHHVALWAYLLIAFVVLPVFVPLAVIALEPARRRKLMMVPFALTGTVIAVILFAAMIRGPIGVKLAPYHLSYGVRVTDGLLIVVLYVVAVCGALLISGIPQRRYLRRCQPRRRHRHCVAHYFRVRFYLVCVGGRLQCRHYTAPPLR